MLRRGAYDAPAEPVEPTPGGSAAFAADWPRNRLGLARWLTDRQASADGPGRRSIAGGRAFFGRGIVATPEDFGSQGQLPSHPELLDWLARTFIDSGWDVKKLLRLIVTSATYRQASEAAAGASGARPDNALARSRAAVPAAPPR